MGYSLTMEPHAMLLHLTTICVGLIIAFGLQQIIGIYQRRQRIRKARAAEERVSKSDD
jgi:hypothetical protein